jgi:predicted metalloendopeptidase
MSREALKKVAHAGVGKAREFFASCNNQKRLNEKGTEPLLVDINDAGGWDALANWNNVTFDFTTMLYRVIGVHSTGALFSISVQMDPQNYSNSIFVIDQDGLTLPAPEFYLNGPSDQDDFIANPDETARQYQQLIQNIISLLGGKGSNKILSYIKRAQVRILNYAYFLTIHVAFYIDIQLKKSQDTYT